MHNSCFQKRERKKISLRFGLDHDYDDLYYRRINLASIWRLLKDIHDSLFDLIDDSAISENVLSPCMGLTYHENPEQADLSYEGDEESTSTEILE
jgi:hypothetical protein